MKFLIVIGMLALSANSFAALQHAPFSPEEDARFDALEKKAGPAASVPAVATANATDLASSEALANQLKVTLNALLANLKAQGMVSPP